MHTYLFAAAYSSLSPSTRLSVRVLLELIKKGTIGKLLSRFSFFECILEICRTSWGRPGGVHRIGGLGETKKVYFDEILPTYPELPTKLPRSFPEAFLKSLHHIIITNIPTLALHLV